MSFKTGLTGLGVAKGVFGAMLIAGIASSSASAALVLDFGTASDYDDNFREVTNASSLGWDSNGDILRTTSGTSVAIYDRTSVAGKDVFSTGTFSFDFQVAHAGSGVGFFSNIPTDSETAAYLATASVDTSGTSDLLRIYKGVDPLSTTGVVNTPVVQISANKLALNTWYTLTLAITESEGALDLNLSVFSTGATPTEVWSASYHDATPLAAGQIGIRATGASGAAGERLRIDNFTIVPEPATAVFFAGASLLAMGRRRRAR